MGFRVKRGMTGLGGFIRGMTGLGSVICGMTRLGAAVCDTTARGGFFGVGQITVAVFYTVKPLLGGFYHFVRKLHRHAIMPAYQVKADYIMREACSHLAEGLKIALRLRHFLVVDRDDAAVHPRTGEVFAVGGLALGYLVFVMGEDKVASTPVDVNFIA